MTRPNRLDKRRAWHVIDIASAILTAIALPAWLILTLIHRPA